MMDGPVPSGRVVVTGIGAVTPLGTGIEKFWPRMLAGESGVTRVTHIDPTDYTTRIAAEVKDFDPGDWLEPKEARRIDNFIAYAVAAATMAVQDSCLPTEPEIRDDIGVLIGSGIGGLQFLGDQHRRQIAGGPSRVSPFLVPYMIPDMASGYVSILNGLRGPNTCVVTACSTGTNAIGDAYHIIKRGDAAAMLAGGTEAPITEIALAAFCAARALSQRNDEPEQASRPFDLNRDGFVIAEGAGVLVLEDYAFAKARNARMYGEIVGYGMSGDAFHITQPAPHGDGARRAMLKALKSAGLEPGQIDYVNAHGTSTEFNDKTETEAIKNAFGEAAYRVPISSTKSMIGHTLGAAGAIEAIICLLAIRDGVMPPTINLDTPDPECDLDYIPNFARKADVRVAMSNSFGFGGHNATLILQAPPEGLSAKPG